MIEEDPTNLLGQDGDWSGALYRLHMVARGRMPRREEFMDRWLAYELELNELGIEYRDELASIFRTRNFVLEAGG